MSCPRVGNVRAIVVRAVSQPRKGHNEEITVVIERRGGVTRTFDKKVEYKTELQLLPRTIGHVQGLQEFLHPTILKDRASLSHPLASCRLERKLPDLFHRYYGSWIK
jgi:hypothetical protein